MSRKNNDKKQKSITNKIVVKRNKTFGEEIATLKTVEGMRSFLGKIIPNPDEVLKRTGKTISYLRTLANDGQIATCIQSRSAGITSLEHRLRYSDENKKYSDFYDKLLKKIDVEGFIKSVLKAPAYGFQPIEIIWECLDDKVIPSKITAKPQEWFYFNTDNELCLKNKEGLVITEDMKKFLCPVVDDEYLNPYGRGYLSRCFWDVVFKKGSLEFWIKFAEKWGMPYIIAKYEEGTAEKDIDKLLDSAEQMIQDAVAAIPNTSSVEVMEAGGKSATAEIYKGIIDLCDASISKNILGQTLTTESSKTGSYALGEVHFKVRQDIINSDKKLVETCFNKLLKWVHELNFGDEFAPEFELFEEEEVNKTLAERDRILSDTGVRFSKQYFLKTYGFSEDDIEVSESSENASNFSENKPKQKELSYGVQSQSVIDDFINGFNDNNFEEIMNKKLVNILKNFSETRDSEQALEELALLYPEKNDKSLEETLTKAIFLSNLWGQVEHSD